MSRYVVISNHPPNACPSANKVLRERGHQLESTLTPLMQKHKIRPEIMVHLDPGHKVLWVLDAPSAESVRDLIYEGGLAQWNDFEFYMTTKIEDLMAVTDKLAPIW